MTAIDQPRHIALSNLAGFDHLQLRKLQGSEEVSGLFEYQLELISPVEHTIDPRSIIGRDCAVRLDRTADEARFFHGIVREFRHTGWSEHFSTWRATVVPWLWLLTQTTDCRIFQNRTTDQIVAQIFEDLELTDFEFQLRRDYQPREYCVQYRESDFNFVSRLLEEEGIFYFFEHTDGAHKLVLADDPTAWFDLPEDEVVFPELGHTDGIVDQLKSWEHVYSFHSGGYAQTDYNFKTPANSLMAVERSANPLGAFGSLERYDYHGRHRDTRGGLRLARNRMEEQEAQYNRVCGTTTYRGFTPGGKFRIAGHRDSSEIGRQYAIRRVEITAAVQGGYETADDGDGPEYECRFECLPAEVAFRAPSVARKPIVEGPQTAVVVGPPGEEIYPDEFGRVKVQFHWDREGAYDDASSCWIRVSQGHAGKGWGGIDLPRIGEEVIVDFLEGDPDEPIITGRVYNAQNMPPFALPASMTRSGMKSNTHKGSGYNEFSMDDTAGNEQIRVHAQHNMDTTVGNNQTLIVNVDRTSEIGNNDTTKVGNDQAESVGNNKKVDVGNNMNVNVGNKLVFTAGTSITLKCGASKIHMNSGGLITITGTIITTAAAASASVVAPMTQVVGGAMLTTVGGLNMMSGGVTQIFAGLCSVTGGKVDLAASGTTSIKGGTITLN